MQENLGVQRMYLVYCYIEQGGVRKNAAELLRLFPTASIQTKLHELQRCRLVHGGCASWAECSRL